MFTEVFAAPIVLSCHFLYQCRRPRPNASSKTSDTPLAKMVQSPQLVRDIDWLNRCWPEDRKQEGQFPKVHGCMD